MAIKIQTQQTFIPIELGELEFKFDLTDESISNFRKEAVKVQKELEKLSDDEDAHEQAKNILNRGFDLMLGEGSFEQIYNLTPSVLVLIDYFAAVITGISDEIDKRGHTVSQRDKVEKYLKNKKK